MRKPSSSSRSESQKRLTGGTLLIAALASGPLLGCMGEEGAASDVDISATEQPLYVLSSALWPSRRIPVCWENPGTYTTQRDWVKNAVDRTWARQTGFVFTDWATCTSASKGIRIQINDTDNPTTTWNEANPATSALGRNLDGMTNGMVLNFTFGSWDQNPTCIGHEQWCIENIAAHEFGHALGLAHEQNRPDTDPAYAGLAQGQNGDRTIGAWNINSIMNYANPAINNNGVLDPKDVSQMRIAYGAGPIKLINKNASLCLGVVGVDSHGAGAGVETYYCDANASDTKRDEEWIPELVPGTSYYRLVNSVSGLCLGVAGVDTPASGSTTEVYYCDPVAGDPRLDEQWSLSFSGGETLIQNRKNSSLCLGVGGTNGTNPSGVIVATCNSGFNQSQVWYAKPTSVTPNSNRSTVRLRNMNSLLCLGVTGVDVTGITSGSTETYYCDPTADDPRRDGEWTMEPTSNGYFRLRNSVSDLCLGVMGTDSHSAGTPTDVSSCPPTAYDPKVDEEWTLVQDEVYTTNPNGGSPINTANPNQKWLKNRKSGLCLGVNGVDNGGAGAGTEVYTCGAAAGDARRDQVWLLY